jgi:thiol:disulfide interchange protein DsbD
MRRGAILVCAALAAGALPAHAQEPVHWSVAPALGAVPAAGKTFIAEAIAEVDAGWHVYDLTQLSGGPFPTSFKIDDRRPFRLDGRVTGPPPQRLFDPNFNIETLFHVDHATFAVPVAVAATTQPGRYALRLTVTYQTCNDRFCLPPKDEDLTTTVAVRGEVATSRSDAPVPPVLAPTNSVSTSSTPSNASKVARVAVRDLSASRASTLPAYVALAALMGALSLLTPCVFPMVPITVSYFTNRGGRSRRDGVTHALLYGIGIILTFTALGFTIAIGFGASGLNRFAANPWLNLGVTALFLGFALSLFGVYELALPSRLVNAAVRADTGKTRYVSTLMMGLAFTLTSFTCTAPFLGTLLVVASQGDWQWPMAGMLAFSGVFALPFVALAFAPQLVSALPRSGVWLIAVKTSMGLLELAAAMKFLSNVDLVWGLGMFTRTVVLVAWIAIALLLCLYLGGLLPLGRGPRLPRPGPGRLAAVAASAVLAIWLSTGLSGRRLGELEAFLPPADLAGRTQGNELSWIVNDYQAALAQARLTGRPMVVDFTGYTCTNCRWMEANMFPHPDVRRELARYVRVRLYTDGRGDAFRRHQQMEEDWFGTVALPYYAVVSSAGQPVVAFGGLTRDAAEFTSFLRTGLE